MKARHKDTGEIVELAEEGIISSDGRRFCWYQVELIPEPIDGERPEVDLDAEIKKYTERLYNETFGNGQSTLDEFDWEDISTVIEDTAKHFCNHHPSWKPSREQMKTLRKYVMGDWRDFTIGPDKILTSLYNDLKKL